MRSEANHRERPPFIQVTFVAVICALAGAGQAFGEPAEHPSATAPNVVVTGGFGCQLQLYSFYQPPLPDPEPIEYATRMQISIGFSATGGFIPASAGVPGVPGVPPLVGPGFGGRPGRPVVGGAILVTPSPISGGAGVANSFDGGTIDDCRGFAETVRAAARRLGCAVSKVSVNNPLPVYGGSAQVSFVCEAPADQAIHTIGELDRVVLALEPELGE